MASKLGRNYNIITGKARRQANVTEILNNYGNVASILKQVVAHTDMQGTIFNT